MTALKLTRRTFVEARIEAETRTAVRCNRTIRDYDEFRNVAVRASNNPLLEWVCTIVTFGDITKRNEQMTLEEMWLSGYDDGQGTEWRALEWKQGCRARDETRRTRRFDDVPLAQIMNAHREAGKPTCWVWASFQGAQLADII